MIKQTNKLAEKLHKETGKVLIGVRVFDNCLLCYFSNNSGRFVSKDGEYWGETGLFYIPSVNYSRSNITLKIAEQFPSVVRWMDDYVNSNRITKWLMRLNKKQSYDY